MHFAVILLWQEEKAFNSFNKTEKYSIAHLNCLTSNGTVIILVLSFNKQPSDWQVQLTGWTESFYFFNCL